METGLGTLKKSLQDRPARDKFEPATCNHEPSSPSSLAAPVTPTLGSSLFDAQPTSDADAASPNGWPHSPNRAVSPETIVRTGTPSPLARRKSSRVSRGATPTAKDADSTRTLPTTAPSAPSSSSPGIASIDPLSQHIFMRTADLSKASRLRGHSSRPESPVPDGFLPPNADSFARHNSLAVDAGREKRKSFLGRLSMRGKKKDELSDNASESGEPRTDGSNAQVFSFMAGSGGFIPHHKEPPRYIRVKAHDKKTREFDRMFLAQELIGTRPLEQPAGVKVPLVTISTSSQARRRAPTGGAVWTTEFSKDGKYLAAGGRGHVVRVWAVIATQEDRRAEEEAEVESGSLGERLSAPVFLENPVREFEGHTGDILDLSWSKNNFLLSTAMDKTVRLWHISRQECLCTFKHKELVSKVAFHPKDDRFFLAGCLDAVLRLWSIPDKNIAYSTQLPDMITAVAFSPDGKVSMAGLLNGYCHFFDTEGLKPQSQMHVRSSRGRNAKGSKITGIVSMVPPGARDADAKVLITSTDSRVRVYNLRDKTLDGKFKGHEHSTTQLCASFSDDGKYVICGSEDSKAFVWSMSMADSLSKDRRPCEFFDAHSDMVTTAIFAPTKTRQLLGSSGDPIYDLCNPPSITLMSVEESMASQSGLSDHALHQDDATRSVAAPKSRPEETPLYIARSTHYDGNIVVTSDETGIIKVFRQDCAANKRKHESWETRSSFSRTLTASGLVGRSGSIITRNSTSSAARSRRGSLTQPQLPTSMASPLGATAAAQQTGDSDRILSWRQDIESSDSRPAPAAGTPTKGERSVSPNKAARPATAIPGGLASDARKQPYAGATLPRSVQFTPRMAKEIAASPLRRSLAGAKLADRHSVAGISTLAEGAATTVRPSLSRGTDSPIPASRSIMPEQKDDKVATIDTQPEEDGRNFGPPEPSFSFRPSDNDDPLRLDPAGASYSFWNLNKWRGIANLRATITGNSISSGDLGGHHHHNSDKSGERFGKPAVLQKSPLAKSFTPTDSDSPAQAETSKETKAAWLAPSTEKILRRRSAVSGSGQEHLTPVTTRASTSDTDQNNNLSHLPTRERSPYTRGSSIVSRLSSELTSSDGDADDDHSDGADGAEMRCTKCGGQEFKARRVGGRQLLHCSRCGKAANDGEESRGEADAARSTSR